NLLITKRLLRSSLTRNDDLFLTDCHCPSDRSATYYDDQKTFFRYLQPSDYTIFTHLVRHNVI
ncbi:MAG: hypothetical protein MI922_01425, partial [Bacteroidales bacterium]|nr:hypothetical protein [Bacteroidales bacterium]